MYEHQLPVFPADLSFLLPCRYAAYCRSKTAEEGSISAGTEPLRPMSLAVSEATYSVPCNRDQQNAVEKLREGVFLVHGPPGTGMRCSQML